VTLLLYPKPRDVLAKLSAVELTAEADQARYRSSALDEQKDNYCDDDRCNNDQRPRIG
jgi:hypothetical protein